MGLLACGLWASFLLCYPAPLLHVLSTHRTQDAQDELLARIQEYMSRTLELRVTLLQLPGSCA
jgi:hypothetical protein